MGFRNSIKNALTQPTSIFLEGSIREVVEEILANRGFVMPGDHRALRERVTELEQRLEELEQRLEAAQPLEVEVAALRKKLNMAMGAIQAATAQLAKGKSVAEQAGQRATSAQATAEAAADGLTGLEDAFAALVERLGSMSASNGPALPNFSLLDGSISDLKKGLANGKQDPHLPALLAAEEAGQARTGAVKAIKQRM